MTAEPPDAADRSRAYALIRHRATNNNTGMHAVLTAGLPRGPQMVTARSTPTSSCRLLVHRGDHPHSSRNSTRRPTPDPVIRTAAAIACCTASPAPSTNPPP